MKQIKVNLSENSYKILIKQNILKDLVSNHLTKFKNSKAIFITDKNVEKLYLQALVDCFVKKNIIINTFTVKPGETSKSLVVVKNISEKLLKKGVKRNDVIYAFGGGIVGDLSGFIASIILRGIKFIQVPTTLLSQVDSSVGGKTGVNTSIGKNLIGSFYQPSSVFIDPNFLKTLPQKQFLAGYAEVLKYSLIDDKKLFYWLDDNYKKIANKNVVTMIDVIAKCCVKKAKIVKLDEKEKHHRMLLNLGHTFAHAIEKQLNYSIMHGEAVSVGLLMAIRLSVLLEKTTKDKLEIVKNHLKKLNLPTTLKDLNPKIKWKTSSLIKNMLSDNKREDENIRFILLNDIGKSFVAKKVNMDKVSITIQEFIHA